MHISRGCDAQNYFDPPFYSRNSHDGVGHDCISAVLKLKGNRFKNNLIEK